MEDYEFYHVDPYYPLDPDRETECVLRVLQMFSPEAQRVEKRLAKLFQPRAKVTHPGCLFPLDAAIIRKIPLLKCETVTDLEATLMIRHK